MSSASVEAFMQQNKIQGELVSLDQQVATVEAAATALGVTPDKILKSVLVLADSNPVLVITNGLARIDMKQLAQQLGVSRRKVNLAKPETTLEITGFGIGAVPPFGHATKLRTLVDTSLRGHEEVFAGGGAIDVVVRLATAELLRATEGEALDLS